ncbi:MAG: hypothetical protein KKF50_05020 [Nanoarchaeota archaeon]|nr:hypothetical protein [Nanoarchaeota archaeon]
MTSKKKCDCKKILKSLSKNYWAVSTVILAVVLILIFIIGGTGGSAISADAAGIKVADWASGQVSGVEVVSVTDEGGLYAVTFSYINPENSQTTEATLQITKDGQNLILQAIPLTGAVAQEAPSNTQTPTPTNIPKTDKPKVELFVMSHCPYGTQAEKGMLPVVGVLGDTIDFNIKFVYYAMHPTYGEVEEQLDQYCIQEEQNDKFIDYLTCWLGKTGSEADGAACLDEAGIDKAKLTTCTAAANQEFNVLANLEDKSSWLSGQFPKFDIHKSENEAYGIGGSPTLVINGVQAQAGRDSASYLGAICSAFNEAPEECNTELPSAQPTPGFGWSTTQAAATAAQCS